MSHFLSKFPFVIVFSVADIAVNRISRTYPDIAPSKLEFVAQTSYCLIGSHTDSQHL